jgi:hypothetical protein
MATWVTLSGGTAWGINFEGVIERTGYDLLKEPPDLGLTL